MRAEDIVSRYYDLCVLGRDYVTLNGIFINIVKHDIMLLVHPSRFQTAIKLLYEARKLHSAMSVSSVIFGANMNLK